MATIVYFPLGDGDIAIYNNGYGWPSSASSDVPFITAHGVEAGD